jgi:lactoylglutathione lyase
VVVEGDFWTATQRNEFTGSLRTPVKPVFITLRVSVEEALRRVQLDPSRRLSRIPEVLRANNAEFALVEATSTDVVIDTTSDPVENVAAKITEALQPAASEVDSLFNDIDCLQIPVPDLEAGLAFYRDALCHSLIWRTEQAAGLRMPGCTAELVLQTDRPELEVNLSVASADTAAAAVACAGGSVLVAPFDISIGRCCVVQDPWGNRLVMLDHRKGRLLTDASGQVQLDEAGRPLTVGGP